MLYNREKHFDLWLVIFTAIASVGGIILVYSLVDTNNYHSISAGVTPSIYKTKIIAGIIGAVALAVLSFISIDKIAKYWKFIAVGGVLFTLLTFTPLGFAPSGSDDRAWLDLKYFTIQPSEVLKLCFIITFAVHITAVREKFNKPLTILGLIGHAAIPQLIVYMQNDEGTGVIFIAITIIMMIAGGLSWKYIVGALAISPAIIWVAWNWILEAHQKQRILVLFNPDLDPLGTGYQQSQGKLALQSGGLFGKGLFSKGAEDFVYVSESQNDFIFSYAGQVLGFIGCGIIILILFLICLRTVTDSAKCPPLGSSVCAGVFALIFSHTFINIGMVLGFMPVIGVPLPFISAGGTAMITMLTAIGLVQSSLRSNKYGDNSTAEISDNTPDIKNKN